MEREKGVVRAVDQIERIKLMERYLDRSAAAVKKLEEAFAEYEAILEEYEELKKYYFGPLWRRDFDDDCAGMLPAGLKRGVLSEDAVYDLVSDVFRLRKKMRRLGEEETDDEKR